MNIRGGSAMSVFRSPYNPIIKPEDVKPSREDYEVVCVLNAAVTKFMDEIILLLRVAERPINENRNVYLCPVYDCNLGDLKVVEFPVNMQGYDYSDSRVISTPVAII
jgi:beta-1,2-mannobiose phosphorylase / 1,2-beta-oligomannan phosphorylase